jgi:hypothetical protein
MDGTLVGVGLHNSIWRKWNENIKIVNKIYPTFIEQQTQNDAPPHFLKDSNASPKVENNGRKRS